MSASSNSEGRSVRDRTLWKARGTSDSGSPGSSKTRASSIADESAEPRAARSPDPRNEAMTPRLYSQLRQLARSRFPSTASCDVDRQIPRGLSSRFWNTPRLVYYAAIRSLATLYAIRCLKPISQDFPLWAFLFVPTFPAAPAAQVVVGMTDRHTVLDPHS